MPLVEQLEQRQHNRHLKLTVGTGSDPGTIRKHQPNEDSLFAIQCTQTYGNLLQPFGVFVVADGMGGHAYGQEASNLAIRVISSTTVPSLLGNAQLGHNMLLELLVNSVQRANGAVYQYNQQKGANMGTTVTAVLIVDANAYVANVGDSRTYLYREPDGLRQVTHDHSVVAHLLEAGAITSDDISVHPKRNQIYRSLGEKASVEVDVFTVPLQAGDRLLLCSDGLWEMMHASNVQRIMRIPAAEPSQIVEALIQAALKGGGRDNVSAIVVFVS